MMNDDDDDQGTGGRSSLLFVRIEGGDRWSSIFTLAIN